MAVDPCLPWLFFLHPPTVHSKIIVTVGDYGFLALTGTYYRGQVLQTFCHSTFYVLPPLLQVFLEAARVVAAAPGVFARVSVVAERSPELVAWAAEPAVVSVADVAEPQAGVDIAVVFAALVPVSVVVVEVDSPGRPTFLAFPNVGYSASPSSSVEVVG